MQIDASKSTSGPSPATAPAGAWLWSREAGNFVRVPKPARFELHPIAETELRFHALARGERVEVAAPTFLLSRTRWASAWVHWVRRRRSGVARLAIPRCSRAVKIVGAATQPLRAKRPDGHVSARIPPKSRGRGA